MEEILKTGAWIVHNQYGVGQISGIETKIIGGTTRDYFRVTISTGVYWLPIQKIPEHVRSVSSKYILEEALCAMGEQPNILSTNYKIRNKEVVERAAGATLQEKGEIIRDLSARKHSEGVNVSMMDERQLSTLRQQFQREMAVILDIELQEADAKIEQALASSIAQLQPEG